MEPGRSWISIEAKASNNGLRRFAGTGLETMLKKPWPWFKPYPKMGFGGRGGRYRTGPFASSKDSPRLGLYACEALDMELRIQLVGKQLYVAGPSGDRQQLLHDSREVDRWYPSDSKWLWLDFDHFYGSKAQRLTLSTTHAQAEFLRIAD